MVSSRSPIGFYTFGKGYDFQQDRQVFHSGKQSLRIEPVEANGQDARLSDPAIAAPLWEAVLRHLNDSRGVYQQKGASALEVSWAIQNATVVLQCMQMDAGIVTRDASMARNASWISASTPGAKMVIWTHDAHIALHGESDPPMGSFLRKEYGNDLINFGFAFNQGSFQAKAAGHGLQNFTVQPLPDTWTQSWQKREFHTSPWICVQYL